MTELHVFLRGLVGLVFDKKTDGKAIMAALLIDDKHKQCVWARNTTSEVQRDLKCLEDLDMKRVTFGWRPARRTQGVTRMGGDRDGRGPGDSSPPEDFCWVPDLRELLGNRSVRVAKRHFDVNDPARRPEGDLVRSQVYFDEGEVRTSAILEWSEDGKRPLRIPYVEFRELLRGRTVESRALADSVLMVLKHEEDATPFIRISTFRTNSDPVQDEQIDLPSNGNGTVQVFIDNLPGKHRDGKRSREGCHFKMLYDLLESPPSTRPFPAVPVRPDYHDRNVQPDNPYRDPRKPKPRPIKEPIEDCSKAPRLDRPTECEPVPAYGKAPLYPENRPICPPGCIQC